LSQLISAGLGEVRLKVKLKVTGAWLIPSGGLGGLGWLKVIVLR